MEVPKTIKSLVNLFPWSFDQVIMFIDSVEVTNYGSSDQPIRWRRNSDQMSYKAGADGKYYYAKSTDKGGVFEVDLMSASPANLYLESLTLSAEAGTFVPVFIMLKNIARVDVASGSRGVVQKPADSADGKEESERTWTIIVEDLHSLTGSGG